MISWKYLFVFFTFIFDVLKILLRGLKESWILHFYQSRNFLLFLRPTNFYYLSIFLILDFPNFQNFLIFPRYCHIWPHLYINNNQNYNIYHWINASEFLILGRRVWYVWSALHLNRENFQRELSATLCGAATSATVRATEVPAKKNLIYAMLVRLTRCTVHELASAFILSCLPSSKVFTSVRTRPQS